MPEQPQQREQQIQQKVPGEKKKKKKKKLWQKSLERKTQASPNPAEKKPEHLHQSTPHDRLGRVRIPEKWRTTAEDYEKKTHATTAKPTPPMEPHQRPSKNAKGETTSRYTPLGKGQNQPTRVPPQKDEEGPQTEKQNPMSPDRAGKSQATATTASKTSTHFRGHKEEKKTPKTSDRKRTTGQRPQHATEKRRGTDHKIR